MSNGDIERTLKNSVNLQQHCLENCPQKAQTEENVNHAKGNKTIFSFSFFVQGSKTQVSTFHIIQQIVTAPPPPDALLVAVTESQRAAITWKDLKSNLFATESKISSCTFMIFTVLERFTEPSGFYLQSELTNPVDYTKNSRLLFAHIQCLS